MKKGRKQKPYISTEGKVIAGLRYRPYDRRWQVVATGQLYTEHDEQKAIEKFLKLSNAAIAPLGAEWEIERGRIKERHEKKELSYWHRMRNDILTRPQFCAEKTGIAKLAYLTDLKPPVVLPTPDEIGQTYFDK